MDVAVPETELFEFLHFCGICTKYIEVHRWLGEVQDAGYLKRTVTSWRQMKPEVKHLPEVYIFTNVTDFANEYGDLETYKKNAQGENYE